MGQGSAGNNCQIKSLECRITAIILNHKLKLFKSIKIENAAGEGKKKILISFYFISCPLFTLSRKK